MNQCEYLQNLSSFFQDSEDLNDFFIGVDSKIKSHFSKIILLANFVINIVFEILFNILSNIKITFLYLNLY